MRRGERCRKFVFKEGNAGDTSSTSAAHETSLPMQFPSNCQIAFQNICINAIKKLGQKHLGTRKKVSLRKEIRLLECIWVGS